MSFRPSITAAGPLWSHRLRGHRADGPEKETFKHSTHQSPQTGPPPPAARFTAVPSLPPWRFDGACEPAVNRHHKVNIKTHALTAIPPACFVYTRLTGQAQCLFSTVTRGPFSFTVLSVRTRGFWEFTHGSCARRVFWWSRVQVWLKKGFWPFPYEHHINALKQLCEKSGLGKCSAFYRHMGSVIKSTIHSSIRSSVHLSRVNSNGFVSYSVCLYCLAVWLSIYLSIYIPIIYPCCFSAVPQIHPFITELFII